VSAATPPTHTNHRCVRVRAVLRARWQEEMVEGVLEAPLTSPAPARTPIEAR
jgi:hypothetical protein